MGPGAWSGWCVPWAAIIHARCGNDGALSWMKFWSENFTNLGRGTLHDADFYGASTLYKLGAGDGTFGKEEIMQIEAGQGALHALCELWCKSAKTVCMFPASIEAWKSYHFTNIRICWAPTICPTGRSSHSSGRDTCGK